MENKQLSRFQKTTAQAIAILAVVAMWTAAALAYFNSRIVDAQVSIAETSEPVDICQPMRSGKVWFPIQVEEEFRQTCDGRLQ